MYSRFFGPALPVGAACGRGAAAVDPGTASAGFAVAATLPPAAGDADGVGLGSAAFADVSVAGFSAGAGSVRTGSGAALGEGTATVSPAPGEGGGGPPLDAKIIKVTTPMAAAATTALE